MTVRRGLDGLERTLVSGVSEGAHACADAISGVGVSEQVHYSQRLPSGCQANDASNAQQGCPRARACHESLTWCVAAFPCLYTWISAHARVRRCSVACSCACTIARQHGTDEALSEQAYM